MARCCSQTSAKRSWAWAVSSRELWRCRKATVTACIRQLAKELKLVVPVYRWWVMQYDHLYKYKDLNKFKLWHKLFKKHSDPDLYPINARRLKKCSHINQLPCSTLKLHNYTRNFKTTTVLSTVATCPITVKFQNFSQLNCMAAKKTKS